MSDHVHEPSALGGPMLGDGVSTDMVIELRYRPLGDVLLAEVPLLADATPGSVEVLDGDVDLRWIEVDGVELLAALRVVHARERWRDPAFPLRSLVPLDDLVARADRLAGDSLAARARALVTVQHRASRAALARDVILPRRCPPVGSSMDLVRALLLVAEAVEAAARLSLGHDPVRTIRLVAAVREAAAVLRQSQGRPAPGASVGALRLVAGGVPLSVSERIALRRLLDQTLDVALWPRVAGDLVDLAGRIAPWVAMSPLSVE